MVSIHLSDDDAEVVPLVVKFGYPFTDIILSPDVVKIKNFEEKIYYTQGIMNWRICIQKI